MAKRKGLRKPQLEQGQHVKLPTEEDLDTNSLCPHFSFEFLQKDHCVKSCQKDDQAALAEKVQELSSLTWSQIIGSHRHGLGLELISINGFQSAVPERLKDHRKFISIRFSGMKPMIGYRKGRTFHIVWLDHGLKVYKHS